MYVTAHRSRPPQRGSAAGRSLDGGRRRRRSAYINVCVYVCMYIYIYIHTYIYIYIYILQRARLLAVVAGLSPHGRVQPDPRAPGDLLAAEVARQLLHTIL